MIPATQQQLELVSRRVQRLEQQVQQGVSSLKQLRAERAEVDATVQELRERLDREEARAAEIHQAHDRAEMTLRHAAGEYSKAQLLQKKFSNTMRELHGFNRAMVVVRGRAGGIQCPDSCSVTVPARLKAFTFDAVTADLGALGGAAHSAAASRSSSASEASSVGEANESVAGLHVSGLVEDVLAGFNTTLFTLGPHRAGKSTVLWGHGRDQIVPAMGRTGTAGQLAVYYKGFDATTGRPDGAGPTALVPQFMRALFAQFHTSDVTHFNIRLSFVDLGADGTMDLLAAPGSEAGLMDTAVTMPIGHGYTDGGAGDRGGAGVPAVFEAALSTQQRATSLQVRTEQEYHDIQRHALANRAHRLAAKHRHMTAAGHQGYPQQSPSSRATSAEPPYGAPSSTELAHLFGGHLVMTVRIETFNHRGHYRLSTALFVDVAGGVVPPAVASADPSGRRPAGLTPEQAWAAKGAWAVSDVISMAAACAAKSSATGPKSTAPHQRNGAGHSAPLDNTAGAISRAIAALQLPHRSNRLVQLLRPCLGGNAKSYLCCVVPNVSIGGEGPVHVEEHTAADAAERETATINALAYAHYFRDTCHQALPYDLPPELQRLTREMALEGGAVADDEEADDYHFGAHQGQAEYHRPSTAAEAARGQGGFPPRASPAPAAPLSQQFSSGHPQSAGLPTSLSANRSFQKADAHPEARGGYHY